MDDAQFDAFLERAVQELKDKQAFLQTRYKLGEFARWWYEQEKQTIQFFDRADQLGLEIEFIDIGSYSEKRRSWKWAWANDYVLPALRERALPLRELEAVTGMEIFGRKDAFEIDGEAMAWELAAMAVKHLSALGCYRSPSSKGNLFSFFALMKVHTVN